MVQGNKAMTPASDLAWILEYTMQTIFPVCTLLMVASMIYELETLRLEKVLNREPTLRDRLKYRAYFAQASHLKQWQQQCDDDRKLRDAAWCDAGLST